MMSSTGDYGNRVGFAVGTGRCGTLFLHEVMAKEPAVASSHERNPDNEAFQRYCKWHRLPVDDEGFLALKEREIRLDLENHTYSFEASPYLALSVRELHERFGAKFIFLVRRPDRVVSSFVHKGFYGRPYAVGNPDLAAGYQDPRPERPFTFFARISPRGEFFEAWNGMTQVGKVAWFWRAYNERTLEALDGLPAACYRTVRIEDLDHPKYMESCGFLGIEASLAQADFNALRETKPHAFWRKRGIDEWSSQEITEFEAQVGELAERFGYRYRVAELLGEAHAEKAESLRLGRVPPSKPARRFWRMRRAAAQWLQGLARSVDVS
jgi:hypothetical protein